ncbi:MAG: hypothetical protein ABMA02_11045 [Saprospiraceae bacterium]
MKSRLFVFALFSALIISNVPSLIAQRVVFWKGGAPGMESNWNCPKNWSNNRVPDAFANVVIPDVSSRSRTYPVIDRVGAEVGSLSLESGSALLILNSGSLEIHENVERIGSAKLDARGKLILKEELAVAEDLSFNAFGFSSGKK